MSKVQDEVKVIYFPVEVVDASPFQARKRFREEGLAEMAESVRQHGILQPLIGREVVPGRVELIAGERRLRAARLAELAMVPLILRVLSDAAAEEIMLIENLQREDLSPSEEAEGYQRMLALPGEAGGRLYTQESLALRLGKPFNHVRDRLKLLLCPAELMEAVNTGEVALSVAMLVGRIPDEKERERASKMVLRPELQQVPLNFDQTREMIRESFMVSLKGCGFDVEDEKLVPMVMEKGVRVLGGACTDCPWKSGNNPEAMLSRGAGRGRSAGADANLCTRPVCHAKKQEAAWVIVRRHAEEQGLKVLEGDAARRLFDYKGALLGNCGYVEAGVKPTFEELGTAAYDLKETWKVLMKGALPITLVRHPQSGRRVELLDRATAVKLLKGRLGKVEMGKEGEEEKAEIGKQKEEMGEGSGDGCALGANEDGALGTMRPTHEDGCALGTMRPTAEERERQGVRERDGEAKRADGLVVKAQVDRLLDRVASHGVDEAGLELIFLLAMKSADVLAVVHVGRLLGVKFPADGQMLMPAIVDFVRARAGTIHGWLGYLLVMLLGRALRYDGAESEDFAVVLRTFGVGEKATTEGTENTEGRRQEPVMDEMMRLATGEGEKEEMGKVESGNGVEVERPLVSCPASPSSRMTLAATIEDWLRLLFEEDIRVELPKESGFFEGRGFKVDFKWGDVTAPVVVSLATDGAGWYSGRSVKANSANGGFLFMGEQAVFVGMRFPSRDAAVSYQLWEMAEGFDEGRLPDLVRLVDGCLDMLEARNSLVGLEELKEIQDGWAEVLRSKTSDGEDEVEVANEGGALGAMRPTADSGAGADGDHALAGAATGAEAGSGDHALAGAATGTDGALGTTRPTGGESDTGVTPPVSPAPGYQPVDFAALPFGAQVKALAHEECTMKDVLGKTPVAAQKEALKAFNAKRVKLIKAVKKLKENLASEVG